MTENHEVVLREATEAEFARVDALVAAAYDHNYGAKDYSWDTTRSAAARAAHPQHIWVAVTAAGEIVGTMSGRIYGEEPVIADPPTPPEIMDLRLLAVDPAARGMGIARKIMLHATEVARATGFDGIMLETLSYMHGPQKLYESLGWEKSIGPAIGDVDEAGNPVHLYRYVLMF